MDIQSIMSSQLVELQQTVQLSVMSQAMNMQTSAVANLMEQLPQTQSVSLDPNVGQRIDISI